MIYEKVKLPSYTKGEEIFNSISHGVGILFGVFVMVFCVMKATNASSIAGSVVFAVSIIVLYLSSTLYHALTAEKVKKIFRLIDHSVIFIMISGTSLAVNIISVFPHNKAYSLIVGGINIAVSVCGIALTFIDQEKYKKIQMALYMIVGWTSAVLVYPLFKYTSNPWQIALLILAGGIIYTVGTAFYAIGKKKRYFHSIFHLFVLAGTVFHFFGIYTAL